MILTELPDYNLEQYGDYPFLYFQGRVYSNREALDAANRFAAGLQAQGIGPGDRVIVCMPNCPEVFIAYQAVLRAGAVVLPVMYVLHSREIGFIAEASDASAVVTTDATLPAVREAVGGLGQPPRLFVFGAGTTSSESDADIIDADQLIAAPAAAPAPVEASPDDTAVILYTSGTTGQPKGVMLTHRNLYSNAAAAASLAPPDEPAGTTLGVLPLAHIYGFTTANVLYLRGSAIVVMPRFDTQAVFKAIQDHRVTRFSAVPAMIYAMVNDPAADDYDLSSLESVGSGSAPLPVTMIHAFKERFGADIYEGYGLSEAAPTVSAHRQGEPIKPGSVGRAFPGVELRIADPAGEPLPVGEVGELLVRGENVTPGYFRNDEATREALRDGWLHTGDMAQLDEDGYLYIVDRKKDLILRGGFNIYPRDLEETISRHAGVAEVAVVGVPSDAMGEEVVAVVVAKEGATLTEEALIGYCQEQLAKYKTPRAVVFLDALPRNGVGKILKKALRDEAQRRVATAEGVD